MRIILLLAMLSLTGCMGAKYTPEQLQSSEFSNIRLCNMAVEFTDIYTPSNKEAAIAEIKRRNLITDAEWGLINKKGVYIESGISICAVLLAVGLPPTRVHTYASQYGTQWQYVFDRYNLHVFVEKGVVTSWSN